LIEFLDARHPEIAKQIAEKRALEDSTRALLDKALTDFKGIFQAAPKA
jgi:F-type H+-transporting ATPase subunit alpha